MVLVVAIVGLLIGVSTVTLRNVTRSDLRSAARRTAGAMRFAFDRATMTGSYVRLAFDMDKGEVWAEGSEDRVSLRFGAEQQASSEAKGPAKRTDQKAKKTPLLPFFAPGKPGAEGGAEGDEAKPAIDVKALSEEWEADQAPPERPPPRFQLLKGHVGRKIKLARGISIAAVVTPRLIEPVEKGIAYVYFFPQGNSEPAIVHFADRNDEVYSVVLHPLTGQAAVFPCLYRIPEDFDVPDTKRGRGAGADPCAARGGI